MEDKSQGKMKKKFYITTTIPYVNAKPHIGFALEIVQADAVARYRRLMGDEVFFNFGTDEHGQKIYQKALEEGKDPQTYTDEYAASFGALKQALNLSYDAFIRTTDSHHKAAAQEFWRRCETNGDIYKKLYKIKYCVGCELEKTDSELVDGKCPFHPNLQLEIREEENYFFRFSKYQNNLLQLYAHEGFLIPHFRLNEITSLIEREGLQDFSISRLKAKMPWGVPVPGDDEHVMYVWFDALVNYISTLGWPEDEEKKFKDFWPGIQFAGKDQVRQQAAMWQAMLYSAGLPNTKQIFIHGFVNVDGKKMSKSLGNVISPDELVRRYGVDGTRYQLLKNIHPYEDTDVSWEKLDEWYNADLANGIGNVTARVMQMAETHLSHPVPVSEEIDFGGEYKMLMEKCRWDQVIDTFVSVQIKFMDQRIATEKPYEVVKNSPDTAKETITELVWELSKVGVYLKPFLPDTSEKILSAIKANKKPETLFARK
jgi:methionyl-tRNA synthetase